MYTKTLCNSALGCILCSIHRNLNSHHPGFSHSTELLWAYSLGFLPSLVHTSPFHPLHAAKTLSYGRKINSLQASPSEALEEQQKALHRRHLDPSQIPPNFSRGSAAPQLGAHVLCPLCNAELLSTSHPLQQPTGSHTPQEMAERKPPPTPNT